MAGDDAVATPRAARWMLRRLVGSIESKLTDTDPTSRQIESGLDELFRIRTERHGMTSAHLWYWRQVIGFALRWRALRRRPGTTLPAGHGIETTPPGGLTSPFAGVTDDLRQAVRVLRKDRRSTALIILVLALGVGLNTAAFSLVDYMVLDPFPFPESERLVDIVRGSHQRFSGAFNHRAYEVLGAGGGVFEGVAAYRDSGGMSLEGDDGALVHLIAAELSAAAFSLLRVEPALGRAFTPDEEGPDAGVVIISNQLWESRFGADPEVLGRTIRVGGGDRVIVGVMPPGFRFYESRDLWVPLPVDGVVPESDEFRFAVVGRLRDGVGIEQAQAALTALVPAIDEALGEPLDDIDARRRAFGLQPAPLAGGLMVPGRVFTALFLQLLTGFVLLVACANLASLMFARGVARGREIALRHALGASRVRLVRQILVENLVLAFAGGVAGVLVAVWGHALFMANFPNAPLFRGIELDLDARVLGFALGLSTVAVLLFGTRPALALSKPDLGGSLREWGFGATGPLKVRRGQDRLVIAQVSLSLILLVGASLTARSMLAIDEIDPGFDAESVYGVIVSFPGVGSLDDNEPTMRRIFAAMEANPAIAALAWRTWAPAELIGDYGERRGNFVEARTGTTRLPAGDGAYAVSSAYFESFGLSLLRGRAFAAGDVPGSPPVVVLSERAADLLWPGQNPVGKQIRYPGAESWLTVVGVVSDRTLLSAGSPSGEYGMRAERWPYVYAAASQVDAAPSNKFWVRPNVGPGPLNEILRATIAAVDPRLTFSARSVWQEDYATHQATYHMVGRVLNAFGLIAVLLSALGTYSVMSLAWAQRAREVGVRMAFGASTREVVGLVLRHGQRMAVVGVVVGTAISAAVYRLAAGVFFDVSPWDPVSYFGVAVVLSAMAILSGLGPARSAIRNDPVEVLRRD